MFSMGYSTITDSLFTQFQHYLNPKHSLIKIKTKTLIDHSFSNKFLSDWLAGAARWGCLFSAKFIINRINKSMTENFDMSHQESVADSEPNLSELKKEVEITPSTLKDITNKEQFLERVIELSNNAKESINIQRAKEALVYLTEAEKILEYAASRGKNIDKYIIVSVLHNEACCYQKIWELDKCSQYLEALIYNFNSFMKNGDHSSSSQDSSSTKTNKNKSYEESTSEAIDRKTFLAKYYLQFCAVNSQTDNHSGALVAARKSIEILKSVFKQMADLLPSMKKATYQKKSEFDYKIRLIEIGSRVNDNVQIQNYDSIFQAAKYYLRQWKESKDNKDRPERNYILEEEFKNYSIGNAMQIVPMTFKEFQERDLKNYTGKIVLEKILLMALGYFTISTQLRLIAGKKFSKRQGEKTNSIEYKQSEIYHLLSIIIAAACVPFEVLYIKHVLSSYSNHYRNDLLLQNENESKLKENLYEQLVFPHSNENTRKITTTNSFVASDHQQTVSKFQKDEVENILANQIQTDRKKLQLSKSEEGQITKNDIAKKMKPTLKNKSKSKSKNLKSITLLGLNEKSEKSSPMPKSPNVHLKSPRNNMIKVKTSFKVKVSAQKIITTNNFVKEDKSKKKRDSRAENIQFDYLLGKSKDVKKMKKAVEAGLNMPSPRPGASSKSSSKRESPVPKYFQYLRPQSPVMKNLKSPKKGMSKQVKNNIQQHYL